MADETAKVEEQRLVDIDLDGEGKSDRKGVKLEKLGEHRGKLVMVKLEESFIYDFTKKPPVKTNVKENKLVFSVQVTDEGDVEIPLFVKPKITRIKTQGFNNSKLYDILSLAKLLDDVKNRSEELKTLTGLLAFLEEKLVGRSIRFASKNSRRGQPDEYSTVGEIYEFLSNDDPVSKEVVVKDSEKKDGGS